MIKFDNDTDVNESNKIKYKYKIQNNVKNRIDKNIKGTIILCIYKININLELPFLEYLLYKYQNSNILGFPIIDNLGKSLTEFINTVLKREYNVKTIGYKEDVDNNILLYVNVSEKMKYDIQKDEEKNVWSWATIDELVNVKKSFNYDIHNFVTKIFLENTWMCFLYDKDDKVIEIPSICYLGDDLNVILFQITFGIFRRSPWSTLGQNYTFEKNYDDVLQTALTTRKRYINSEYYESSDNKRGGIIRLALFTNKIKLFLNKKTDKEAPLTESDILQLDDSKVSTAKKKQILAYKRMKDNEGNWTKNYDSAMLGNVGNKNDKLHFDGHTKISVKNNNNFAILNYIEIDKKI